MTITAGASQRPRGTARRSRLGADDVAALLPYGAKTRWPANFQIYEAGSAADGLSVVLRGHVILRNRIRAGRGFVPAIAIPGETFGIEGLNPGGLYLTDAHATEATETLHVTAEHFRAFLREKPTEGLRLVGQLMAERAQLLERLQELAAQNVEQRLVSALRRLALDRSFLTGDGMIALEVRHHRLLCEMVGATRESIALALGRLTGAGIAERQGSVVLVAPAALKRHISGTDDAVASAALQLSREEPRPPPS